MLDNLDVGMVSPTFRDSNSTEEDRSLFSKLVQLRLMGHNKGYSKENFFSSCPNSGALKKRERKKKKGTEKGRYCEQLSQLI